jgi:hypothetical protein
MDKIASLLTEAVKCDLTKREYSNISEMTSATLKLQQPAACYRRVSKLSFSIERHHKNIRRRNSYLQTQYFTITGHSTKKH